jgi:hypothetical protein
MGPASKASSDLDLTGDRSTPEQFFMNAERKRLEGLTVEELRATAEKHFLANFILAMRIYPQQLGVAMDTNMKEAFKLIYWLGDCDKVLVASLTRARQENE